MYIFVYRAIYDYVYVGGWHIDLASKTIQKAKMIVLTGFKIPRLFEKSKRTKLDESNKIRGHIYVVSGLLVILSLSRKSNNG
jgi:hypothetical protein